MSKPSLLAAALLILQPVIFFRRVLINPDRHIPYDLLGFHTPLADFIAYALRQGEFPLWDPYPYCGYPLHADVQAQLFYPPAWLAIALRNLGSPGTMFYWLEWQVVLHLMLAGLLTFGFLRRLGCPVPAALFGGTAFQLGAFFASQAQHLGAVAGTAWLPLAWWAVWELRQQWRWRWSALLAASLALSFLAGFTATAIVVWTSTALVALAFSSWRSLPSFLWAVPLIAVQLVPTMRWAPWSVASLRGAWNMGAGSPPWALWSLLSPNYWGVFTPDDPKKFTGDYNFTFLYCYCGLGAVALFAFTVVRGRATARRFAALSVFFFIAQCGSYLPKFDQLIVLVPTAIRGAVYMNFFLGAACLALVLAAALGAARLRPSLCWALAVFTAAELILVAANRPMNTGPNSWRWVTSETQVDQSPNTARLLERLTRAQTPPWRLDVLDLNFSFTMNASWRRLATPNGDNPLAPLSIVELRRQFASGQWWERQLPVVKPESPLLDLLNVRYLLADTVREDRAALARAGWTHETTAENGVRVYRRDSAVPRFFLTESLPSSQTAPMPPTPSGPPELLGQAPLKPLLLPAADSLGSLTVRTYALNTIDLEVNVTKDATIASSETYAPGWRAWVDGVETPVRLVNEAFRAIRISPGSHRVRFAYVPPDWPWSASLSAVAWLLTVFAAAHRYRGRIVPKPPSTPIT